MRKLFISFDDTIIDDKKYNTEKFKSTIKKFLKNRIRKYSTQLNIKFIYNYSDEVENTCGCFKIKEDDCLAYIYIIMNNCEESDNVVEKIITVLLHEIGHFISFNNKYLKSDGSTNQYDFFYDNFLRERVEKQNKFKNYDELYSYWKNNPEEIFANNFAYKNIDIFYNC